MCIPNPVSAMFHYLNYYRLTQRWTQPRTLPDNQRWVERGGQRIEMEGKDGRHYSVCRLEQNKSRDGNEGLGRTPETFRTHNKNDQTLKI